jgi:hypothetical protein
VLEDGGEIQPPPPVTYDTPAYWREAEEVLAVSRALTAEQKRSAEQWNLDRGSVTPARVWNRKAREPIDASLSIFLCKCVYRTITATGPRTGWRTG